MHHHHYYRADRIHDPIGSENVYAMGLIWPVCTKHGCVDSAWRGSGMTRDRFPFTAGEEVHFHLQERCRPPSRQDMCSKMTVYAASNSRRIFLESYITI